MRRWFIPTLTLGLLLTIASLAWAQTPAFTPSPHVYRVIAAQCPQPPAERTQTGFRVKDRALVGIVTALHGVVGCKSVSAIPDGGTAITDLIIVKGDIARDVALLWSEQMDELPLDGLIPEEDVAEDVYNGLTIIGYHSGISRQAPPEAVALREETVLVDLVPDALLRALGRRRSPALDIQVLNINGNLLPGHSGAPILNGNGRVVGVGNGGIDLGRVGWGWAIPWHEIEWKSVATSGSGSISPSETSRLDELARMNPHLVFSFSDSEAALTTPTRRPSVSPTRMTPVIALKGASAAREIDFVALPDTDQ